MNIFKIILILIVPFILNAKVVLKVPDSFYKGEVVEFSITASGSNVQIPDINSIDGIPVQTLGSSRQTNIINGQRSDKITKSYIFNPKKDITIPSFKVKIDDKIEQTKPKTIKAVKVDKTTSSLYNLDIEVDNTNPYVGESIVFTLIFKYKRDLDIVNLEFQKPTFENFWVKEVQTAPLQPKNDEYIYQKLSFLLFPQKAGKLEIGPLKIGVVRRDNNYGNSFFMTTSTKNTPVYSNTLTLNIRPLPQNTKLIGDFEISSSVDKTTINQGDAVSYKVTIKGRGNIDDIDEIKLDLPNATIYENPSKKEYDIKDGKYGGVYTKVFSIVATKDFTIPSVKLKYFYKGTASVKVLETKAYDIKVNGQKKKETSLQVSSGDSNFINKEENIVNKTIGISNISSKQNILFVLFGIVIGILISTIYVLIRKNKKVKKSQTPIIKIIKKCKNQEQLLKELIAYINIDEDLDKMIYKLEHKVENNDFKSIKKEILTYLENNDIKSNI